MRKGLYALIAATVVALVVASSRVLWESVIAPRLGTPNIVPEGAQKPTTCPKCGGVSHWMEYEPLTGLSKFECSKCRHQFSEAFQQ